MENPKSKEEKKETTTEKKEEAKMEKLVPEKPEKSTTRKPAPGVNLDELSELSGEKAMKQVKYTVPILKFNGNKGRFTLLTPGSEGNLIPKDMGTEVEGVILKIRRILTAFTKDQAGESISYFSNEHNTWKDSLVIFERRKSASGPKMVTEGTRTEIRESWPDLKLRQYLYMLFAGEVVKLGIQGGNLGPLFSYFKDLGPKEHIFEFVTKFTCHKEENDAGMTYFRLDFKKDKKADMGEVAKQIKEVSTNLNLQDKSYEESAKFREEEFKAGIDRTEERVERVDAETPGTLDRIPRPKGAAKVPPGFSSAPPENQEENEVKVKDIPL